MPDDQTQADGDEDQQHQRLNDAQRHQVGFVGAQDDAGADFDRGQDWRDAEDSRDHHAQPEAEEQRLRINFPHQGLAQRHRAIFIDDDAEADAHHQAQEAAYHAQHQPLRQEEPRHLAAAQPESLDRRDLVSAPPHQHQHGVHDAHAADQQRAQAHHHYEVAEVLRDDLVTRQKVVDICRTDAWGQSLQLLGVGLQTGFVRRISEEQADAVGGEGLVDDGLGISQVEVSEAEEGVQEVGHTALFGDGDDAAHGECLLCAADAHNIADADVILRSQVVADDHIVAAREKLSQGRVGRVDSQDGMRRRVCPRVDEVAADEAGAAELPIAVGFGDLHIAAAHEGGSPRALLMRPCQQPLQLCRREGIGIVAAEAAKDAVVADEQIALDLDAHIVGQRIAHCQAQRTQRHHRGHAGGDAEDSQGRPAAAAADIAQRVCEGEAKAMDHGASSCCGSLCGRERLPLKHIRA